MKFVDPIRSRGKIKEIRNYLNSKSKRDYFFFSVGISTGLRISDLRVLKVGEVRDRTHIQVVEKKTGKRKRIPLGLSVIKVIDNYTKEMSDDEYLFKSRQGSNKPLGRNQCGNIVKKAALAVGLKGIGNHSLRKTFGYHHYQENKDIAVLMNIFNHSSQSITMRYLGLDQDEIDKSLKSFDLLN